MQQRKKDQKRHFMIESNDTQIKREKQDNRTKFFRGIRSFFWVKKIFSKKLLMSSFGILLLGAGGFAIFSDYFDIKSIEITRSDITLSEKEEYSILKDFQNKNMLFSQQKNIEKALMANFIGIKTVKVKEIWPNRQEVEIEAILPAYILMDGDQKWFLSEDAIVLSPERIFSEEELPQITLVNYLREGIDPLEHGTQLDINVIKLLLETQSLIAEHNVNINETKWLYHAREGHYHIMPQETDVWIDLQQPIQPQIDKIDYAEESDCSWRQRNLQYIDLRIPKKIFCK